MADVEMINAPPTPAEDAEPTAPAIDFSPATVPYDEDFENALMHAILHPSNTLPHRIPLDEPPHIPPTELPIPLTDERRTHPSPIPGVLLTHKNGYHTGGPGPSPSTVADYAEKFISERGIQDARELERAVEENLHKQLEVVKERMREREQAVKKNEAIKRELEDLEIQRKAELRVEDMIKAGRKG